MYTTKPTKVVLLISPDDTSEPTPAHEVLRGLLSKMLKDKGRTVQNVRGYADWPYLQGPNIKAISPKSVGWIPDQLIEDTIVGEKLRLSLGRDTVEFLSSGVENPMSVHQRCRCFATSAVFGESRGGTPVFVYASGLIIRKILDILWCESRPQVPDGQTVVGYVLTDIPTGSSATNVSTPEKQRYLYASAIQYTLPTTVVELGKQHLTKFKRMYF